MNTAHFLSAETSNEPHGVAVMSLGSGHSVLNAGWGETPWEEHPVNMQNAKIADARMNAHCFIIALL